MRLKWKKSGKQYESSGRFFEYRIEDRRDYTIPGWTAYFKQHGGWVWMEWGLITGFYEMKRILQKFEDESIEAQESCEQEH